MRSSLALVAAALAVAGCADFQRGPAPSRADGSAAAVEDTTFETLVYPILQLECQFCHSAGGEADTSELVLSGDPSVDRAMIRKLVTPGDPSSSRLLRAATGVDHAKGERFTAESPEYKTISDWIMGLGASP